MLKYFLAYLHSYLLTCTAHDEDDADGGDNDDDENGNEDDDDDDDDFDDDPSREAYDHSNKTACWRNFNSKNRDG